jgi:hypothetical protein
MRNEEPKHHSAPYKNGCEQLEETCFSMLKRVYIPP